MFHGTIDTFPDRRFFIQVHRIFPVASSAGLLFPSREYAMSLDQQYKIN